MSKKKNSKGETLRPLFAALVLVVLSTVSGHASELPDVEDYGSIALYAAPDSAEFNHRLNYPGMSVKVRDSQILNHWSSPDCLILNGSFGGPAPQEKLRAFVKRLQISDGPGILFESAPAETHVLVPKVIKGTYVYFLKDLGKYVTGIGVRVLDGKTIPSLIQEIFGSEQHNLALRYSRGCHLLRN